MLKEFKVFIARGNVVDLAVGVVIGAAFGKIVSSFVEDMLMPPIGLLLGHVDFSGLFLNLSESPVSSIAEAKKAGVPTLNYGIFINTMINFIIIAFSVFVLVRLIHKIQPHEAAITPSTKACKFCFSVIPIQATRCAHCTSTL